MIDIKAIRQQFPILNRTVNQQPLIYFDNAATVQKPQGVIDALVAYYQNTNANVHRGIHRLSVEATEAMEQTRMQCQHFIKAKYAHELIFTRGTTESINLVANGLTSLVKKGDEILISQLEHHSNIVPWQMLCERTGATLQVVELLPNGELNMESFENLLNPQTKLVAISHISNTLGTINPIKEIISKAHRFGAWVLIDGAQAIAHTSIDVQQLDCDFYCFSGHKMYAPTGIGVLYGKEDLLNQLSPYQGGGEMIKTVTFQHTTYADLPFKFEAGTPNIADTVAFGKAINFIESVGLENIAQYENELLDYATRKLEDIKEVRLIGTASHKSAVLSFVIAGAHPSDVGVLLDKMGVAVRTGHHCTQPLMQYYDIPGTVRASFAVYNTFEEIDQFSMALQKVISMLLG